MEEEVQLSQTVLDAIKEIAKTTKGQLSFQFYHDIEKDIFKKDGFKVTHLNIQIRKLI